MKWDYDSEADVLMVHMGEPRVAVSYDAGNGLLVRYDEKSGEIVGFEIHNANAKITQTRSEK